MSPDNRNPKEQVVELLRRLPDDVTLEEIGYSVFMLGKAELARCAILAGDVFTHAEAKARIRERWLGDES